MVAYKSLYSFGHASNPFFGALLDLGGTLYGTTNAGGAHGLGIVFSITTSGKEKPLYSFGGSGSDGEYPLAASLIDVKGKLYGTTIGGGGGGGTVYSITPAGVEKTLYAFGYADDGVNPTAGLIDVNGIFYGTTESGGAHGDGAVFGITTSGDEHVVYSFGGNSGDGEQPNAALLDVKGTLYGTTQYGGKYNGGVVFSVSTRGAEKVLHSFGSGKDGSLPVASLIDVNGTLYGTTTEGGAYAEGTVFSTSAGGTEKVLHSFGSANDGMRPEANLLDVNGTLYGTTSCGGAYDSKYCIASRGAGGTVFSITTSGTEQVLYSFGKGRYDGAQPYGSLIDVKNTLYGTTCYGGKEGRFRGAPGNGTVFALSL
jgi:uncharacterized repeat protein (TIGR03803 family)